MQSRQPTPFQNEHVPPPPENKTLAAATSCGCGLIFLGTGLLPVLAWLNILQRVGLSGEAPSLPVLLGSLPFAAVGLYFIGNAMTLLVRGQRLSDRLLFNLGMFFLAIPFHYWLFFGKADEGAVTSLSLPGGFSSGFLDTGLFSFILAKIAVAVLVAAMDLYMVSEFFGLGWFALASSDNLSDDEEDDW